VKRYAMRVDKSQQAIVDGLRAAGVHVDIIGRPVDLLTYYRGRWLPMECKTIKAGRITVQKEAKMQKQATFCVTHNVPIVTNLQEALFAVGLS
jgi:hypothetical protein